MSNFKDITGQRFGKLTAVETFSDDIIVAEVIRRGLQAKING